MPAVHPHQRASVSASRGFGDVMFNITDKKRWLSAALLLSSATLVLGCSDDDKGCETGILREVSCGPGNAGTQVQACVDQAWYITTLCEDAQGNVISGTDTWRSEERRVGKESRYRQRAEVR